MMNAREKSGIYAQTFNIFVDTQESVYPSTASTDSCLGHQVEEEEI
jgi:hypothetical protein